MSKPRTVIALHPCLVPRSTRLIVIFTRPNFNQISVSRLFDPEAHPFDDKAEREEEPRNGENNHL